MARSLVEGCGKLGMKFVMATPKGYQFDGRRAGPFPTRNSRARFDDVTDDPVEAVRDAVAVYTDVWASMGQEAESAKRASRFRRLPGERRADVACAATPSSCTACRPIAARK